MSALRPYLAVTRMQLIGDMQYRLKLFSQYLTNIFWGYIRAVMLYVYFVYGDKSSDSITLAQSVSMIWLSQIALNLIPGFGMDMTVWNSIRTGSVGVDLLRPMPVYGYWYARAVAVKVAPFLLAVVPVGLAALIVPAPLGLSAPVSALHLAACVLTLCMGVFVSCACVCLSYAMCMDASLGEAPANVLITVMQILAGGYLPLQLWPNSLQKILYYQPFAGMMDLPLRFYAGTAELNTLPGVILIQLMWGLVIGFIGGAWIKRNLSRLVVQGG